MAAYEGAGKYDDICTMAAQMAGIDGSQPGGVLLIILGGSKGPGFSCQADIRTLMALPDILEHMAKDIRGELEERVKGLTNVS